MRVYNMESPNGNKVANQFVIESDDESIVSFQSYSSTIATINHNDNTITIGRDWDYSMTTGKYRNLFFNEYFYPLKDKKAIDLLLKTCDENGENKIALFDGTVYTIKFKQ